MKTLGVNVFLFALCLGGTALGQDVNYNFEPGVDFTKYKTYRWAQHPDSLQFDQLTLTQLGAAFDAELAKKGLQKTTGESSDLVIVYQFGVEQQKELTAFDSGWGYGPRWGGGMTTATISTISIGSVALDMYDTSNQHLVWRGVASKTIDTGAKPEKRRKNMAKAAAKMLKNYPPPKK